MSARPGWYEPVRSPSNMRAHYLTNVSGRTACNRYGTPRDGWQPAGSLRLHCKRCAEVAGA